jgi:threonine/homoserine/homoserine lactone efflux protein
VTAAALLGMALVALGMVLTPGPAIPYLALIPQFVDPSAGHVVVQGFVLGSLQIAVSFLVNTTLILTAGAIATFLQGRPTWLRWQRRITAACSAWSASNSPWKPPPPPNPGQPKSGQ